MSRPRKFWVKFFIANWYATALSIVVIAADVNAVVHHEELKLAPTAGLLAICAFFIGFSWCRTNSRSLKAVLAANAQSNVLSLDANGIRKTLKSGASGFVPWSSYTSWKEGKSVFVLSGKDGSEVVPIDDANREFIRGILKSNIG